MFSIAGSRAAGSSHLSTRLAEKPLDVVRRRRWVRTRCKRGSRTHRAVPTRISSPNCSFASAHESYTRLSSRSGSASFGDTQPLIERDMDVVAVDSSRLKQWLLGQDRTSDPLITARRQLRAVQQLTQIFSEYRAAWRATRTGAETQTPLAVVGEEGEQQAAEEAFVLMDSVSGRPLECVEL